MRVLVPGGGGRLARAVTAALAEAGARVWAPPRAELDLTSEDLGFRVRSFAPDRVLLAASWTSVDRCEGDPAGARAANVDGVRRLLDAARCPGIYVSTDYVFGGAGAPPYAEGDARAPLQVYGRTKAEAEALSLAAGWAVARVAWLWGDGQGFPRWIAEAARARGEVTVAAQRGTPTPIPPLAAALVALLPDATGIHHLVGGEALSRGAWARLVLDALGLSGVPVHERPPEAVFAGAAPRPVDSALSVTRPDTPRLPGVRAALRGMSAAEIAGP